MYNDYFICSTDIKIDFKCYPVNNFYIDLNFTAGVSCVHIYFNTDLYLLIFLTLQFISIIILDKYLNENVPELRST